MSVDYLIITPPDYEFKTFLERFPSNIKIYDLEDGRYNIQGIEANGEAKNAWIDTWDYKENSYSTLKDAFDKEQLKSINTINHPKFFCLTAGNDAILNTIMAMIADDPNVLIEGGPVGGPIIPGNEFVARFKRDGEVTFSKEELLSMKSKDYFIITPPDYEFETLIKRLPPEISVTDNEYDGTHVFYMEAENDVWHAWLDMWECTSHGFPTVEDAFEDDEQLKVIDTIKEPKFFCVTARTEVILNTVLSMIADDPYVLVCDGTQDDYRPCQIVPGPVIPGDQFVARLKPTDKKN